MATDSEFAEIRDRIIEENLFDPGRGRDHRKVRWPDGRITDQAFLHLWDDRDEAEAFVSRLRKGQADRRWKVFEVDVEGTIDEILDPRHLPLPEAPKVVAIRVEPDLDQFGREALQIWVILDDRAPEEQRKWAALEPIHRAIRDTLRTEGITLHPFIWYRTETEFARQRRDAS